MTKLNKFNVQCVSKLKRTKLFKRGVAIALAATTVGSLSGCGENAPLEGTILESSVVALVDDKYEILKATTPERCFDLAKHANQKGYSPIPQDHDHYINIVTNEYLTTREECDLIRYTGEIFSDDYTPRYVENIKIEGSISSYLTAEELNKAAEKDLNDKDIIKIVDRIKKLPVEDIKEKEKIK